MIWFLAGMFDLIFGFTVLAGICFAIDILRKRQPASRRDIGFGSIGVAFVFVCGGILSHEHFPSKFLNAFNPTTEALKSEQRGP
jgi:hypothetical protein